MIISIIEGVFEIHVTAGAGVQYISKIFGNPIELYVDKEGSVNKAGAIAYYGIKSNKLKEILMKKGIDTTRLDETATAAITKAFA